MKSMHTLLDEAETKWREDVNRDFPLRSNTPVKKDKPASNGRDWEFSTDLKEIIASISKDESLKKKFETIISKYWQGNPEDVARETLNYLLFHELYHPLKAPFSVEGENNYAKKIHQAIRKGILKAEPSLKPLEQIVKVEQSQNGVKDLILDDAFFLDNKNKKYVRDDIVPVWDVLELQGSKSEANFYTITRFLYGVLYGPESTHEFFQEKASDKGVGIAEKALKELIKQSVKLPKKESLVGKVSKLLGKSEQDKVEQSQSLTQYAEAINNVFSSEDRYGGIERLMSVLGPYVTKDMPKGRPDQQGQGSGASPQNILQDLLDGMTPQEQAQFTSQLSTDSELGEEGRDFSDGKPNSISGDKKSKEEYNTLDVFAIHEYYKRNHPKVKIVGGSKVGESVVVDKRENWHLKRTEVINEDQLSKLNLQHIARFQTKTRLPVLISLGNHQYRVNEYEIKTQEIKDIKYVDSQIDVPDIVEFYLDSSGSMYQSGTTNFGFNDGSRWDMLSNVMYGFIDALHQGGKSVGKQTKIRIHNVGDSQVTSKEVTIDDFLKGDVEILKVLFKPENGYSQEDLNLQTYNDGLKRVYAIATDGNLCISDRTKRESAKMKKLAKNPNNRVMMFEIGGTYELGSAIKQEPNIHYSPVYDKAKMLQTGIEVLLSK